MCGFHGRAIVQELTLEGPGGKLGKAGKPEFLLEALEKYEPFVSTSGYKSRIFDVRSPISSPCSTTFTHLAVDGHVSRPVESQNIFQMKGV